MAEFMLVASSFDNEGLDAVAGALCEGGGVVRSNKGARKYLPIPLPCGLNIHNVVATPWHALKRTRRRTVGAFF